MKLSQILSEAIIPPKDADLTKFIFKWTRGDMSAIEHLTPKILSSLKETVQEEKYHLFRGWKFSDHAELKEKLKITGILKPGTSFNLKTDKVRSWTKSKDVAEKFANPRFDSIEEREFSDREIDDMGYDHDDLLGLTVILFVEVDSSHVVADLENLPPSLMAHGHDEQEVILEAGNYKAHVLKVSEHRHTSPSHIDEKALHHWVDHAIFNSAFKPGTFDELLDKCHHVPNNAECAALALIFGFKNQSIVKKLQHLRLDDGDNLSDEMLEKIMDYIRKFHRDGSDPQELRLMWAHFNRSGKTDEAVDDWDLDSVEWEPEK